VPGRERGYSPGGRVRVRGERAVPAQARARLPPISGLWSRRQPTPCEVSVPMKIPIEGEGLSCYHSAAKELEVPP
jgi:hypothetical protein